MAPQMMLNIIAVRPIPSASASAAIADEPGFFTSMRAPKRTSFRNVSMESDPMLRANQRRFGWPPYGGAFAGVSAQLLMHEGKRAEAVRGQRLERLAKNGRGRGVTASTPPALRARRAGRYPVRLENKLEKLFRKPGAGTCRDCRFRPAARGGFSRSNRIPASATSRSRSGQDDHCS